MSKGLGRTQRAIFEVLPRHHQKHDEQCDCLRAATVRRRTGWRWRNNYQSLLRLLRRGLVERNDGTWMKAFGVGRCWRRDKSTINRCGAKSRLAAMEPRQSGSVLRIRHF